MKPVIFTVLAKWDPEAQVWCGECDDIPIAADAPTLDELLAKATAQALDLLPDNHPGIDPDQVHLLGIPSRHTANAVLKQAGLPKAF